MHDGKEWRKEAGFGKWGEIEQHSQLNSPRRPSDANQKPFVSNISVGTEPRLQTVPTAAYRHLLCPSSSVLLGCPRRLQVA